VTSVTSSWNFHEGDEIAPGLTAERLLGGGSSFEAYLAFDSRRYCPVVVKIVRPDRVEDESTLRGLEREADVIGLVNHPAIVRGFHAVLTGPRPYVMLESLDGPRLSTLIRKNSHLPLEQVLPLGIELCSAAHYLGQLDLVHLDIKPSNVIMGAPARLIDLSVARDSQAAARLVDPIGTDAYMAPEQCVPGEHRLPGFASDVWGIGATLFHALAGYRPFDKGSGSRDASPSQLWPQLVDAPYDLPAFIPAEVAKPVLICLNKNPVDRPTPVDLAEMLAGLLEQMPRPRLAGFKISAIR